MWPRAGVRSQGHGAMEMEASAIIFMGKYEVFK
jgi:hypothetical protein